MIAELEPIERPVPLTPFVEVPVRALVLVFREPRDHCVNCRRRRVLYRIHLTTTAGSDKTEARCAPCWGIRNA